MGIGERIRLLRRQNRMTQEQLGEMLGGLDKTTIHKYEAGKAAITANTLLQIATIFGVPVTHLYGIPLSETDHGPWEMIPVYGRVPAGGLGAADDEITGHQMVSRSEVQGGNYFFVRAHGDCMVPQIKDGYLVLIREQPEVEPGEMALVSYENEYATLKRVHVHGDQVMLSADNPAYSPILTHADQVRVIGKVIGARFPVR